MYFSKNLVHLRKIKKLTQSDVASELGIKRNTYANYETGELEPEYKLLIHIARFFAVGIDALLTEDLEKQQLNQAINNNQDTITNLSSQIKDMRTAIDELRKHIKHGKG